MGGSLPGDPEAAEDLKTVRYVLVLAAFGHTGTTALEQLFMSSTAVATLCRNNMWQCEAKNLTALINNRPARSTGAWPEWTAYFNKLGEYWQLHRPVLMLKAFAAYGGWDTGWEATLNAFGRLDAAIRDPRGLPPLFRSANISELRPVYVVLFRPPCLWPLSSRDREERNGSTHAWAKIQASKLQKLAHLQTALARRSPLVVVSFADLVWETARTAKRLERSFPWLGRLDPAFVARPGVDVFAGNQWKLSMSMPAFGAALDPVACCGYDLSRHSCNGTDVLAGSLEPDEVANASAALARLSEASRYGMYGTYVRR